VIAEQTAASASPSNSRVSAFRARILSASELAIATIEIPPASAARESAVDEAALSPARTTATATASPAPLDIPVTYGPAIGFWK